MHRERRDDCRTGGCHGFGRHVQTLPPTLRETAPGEVDVADEEGGEMDLLSVRLLFRRETDRRRFRRVSVRMSRYHSDHRALVAVIYAERGGELKRY
jgi:hypothetical protein